MLNKKEKHLVPYFLLEKQRIFKQLDKKDTNLDKYLLLT